MTFKKITRQIVKKYLGWLLIPIHNKIVLIKKKGELIFHSNKKIKYTYTSVTKLQPPQYKPKRVAGILGYINKKSKTDKSILSAINDGMETLIIYACMDDAAWYYATIEPIIKNYPEKIIYAGLIKNRQKIYDSISDVYDLSASNISVLIKNECKMTGTIYHDK
jgi:hypothetical protein